MSMSPVRQFAAGIRIAQRPVTNVRGRLELLLSLVVKVGIWLEVSVNRTVVGVRPPGARRRLSHAPGRPDHRAAGTDSSRTSPA